jgi:hypothetical protein
MAKQGKEIHPDYLTPAEHQRYLVTHPDAAPLYRPENTICGACGNRALILVLIGKVSEFNVQCERCHNSGKHTPGNDAVHKPEKTPAAKKEPHSGDDV